ncbi:hypothetical protein HO173_012834 [Letharia columbiana]|uniref:Uncharacterized protein n=1 Tax=Letharia columbiana TaxID=112416 RepID=A0A8H6CL09_9LECA|nr:uncharacterized protein HO173_012834 [Letharia columbiana]KAF6225310.1 hypothetical protein HO173_012834 [Letharia columbiana]
MRSNVEFSDSFGKPPRAHTVNTSDGFVYASDSIYTKKKKKKHKTPAVQEKDALAARDTTKPNGLPALRWDEPSTTDSEKCYPSAVT